jgi:superfamily II DNA/RNA helicase
MFLYLGKTAAFVLPILERLLWRDLRLPAIRVLILAPTRYATSHNDKTY